MSESKIVRAFSCPEFYDHPVEQIEFLETHISWVFLTGPFAYKIKKPVNFGFLNFSTLELRKYYCEQELLLNSRFAPQIYLAVLPITELDNQLSLSGQGTIIDYAVKMQQFDHDYLLNKLVQKHLLQRHHIDKLVDIVADFHDCIAIAGADVSFGSEHQVFKPVEENFTILGKVLDDSQVDAKARQLMISLHEQMLILYDSVKPLLIRRKQQGHIRECHGDLHLGNITLIADKIVLFDGIEFSDSLRWIDTISDCAFLIMDLQDHEQWLYAQHFLNGYLAKSGDFDGLPLLNFYKFYRAMVRAKVAGLQLQQHSIDSAPYQSALDELYSYLHLAQSYVTEHMDNSSVFLAISFGLSGSGKSWVSAQLADHAQAILLRSDVERKRLMAANEQIYTDSAIDQVYVHLLTIAADIIKAGYPVIVDATFLHKKWRRQFQQLAEQQQIPFYILSCHAPLEILRQRLQQRAAETGNVSDADIAVMESQRQRMDALDDREQEQIIDIDTETTLDYQSIVRQLLNKKQKILNNV